MKNDLHMTALESRVLFSGMMSADVETATTVSGIVFSDTVVANNKPDAGEGLAGCVVTFNRNSDHIVSTPVTASDGTFSTDLLPGVYHLTIDGPTVAKPYDNPAFVVGTTPITQNFKLSTDDGGNPTPPAQKTDLAVTVSNLPNSLSTGTSSVPVTVTVINKGAAYKGPATIAIYFSKKKTIGSGDVPLKTVKLSEVSVAANSNKPILSLNAAALVGLLPPGKWYVLVRLTVAGDTNAANNIDSSDAATTIANASTNLLPSLNGPVAVNGRKATFKLIVKNTGNAVATGKLTIHLAARPKNGGADIALPSLVPMNITVNPNNGTWTPPKATVANLAGLPVGSYKLVVTLSPVLKTAESKTSDNTVVSSVFVVK
ncbi:MAG TPA: hypothetical protein VFE58_08535 [Tepidisphaeraceae bacterium]|jgi:hypothetical protein|nr:hypothetical protein [Tepidisphaeraceae bacterium]